MKIKYFSDTDTALFEFSSREVEQTCELGEHVFADLDAQGNLVSMTVEHASENANLPEVAVEQVKSA